MITKKLLNMKTLKAIFVLSLTVLIFAGCEKGVFCTNGKGEIVSAPLIVGEFSELEASGAFDIVVSQGETQSIELVGHQNIIEKVETSLIDNPDFSAISLYFKPSKRLIINTFFRSGGS